MSDSLRSLRLKEELKNTEDPIEKDKVISKHFGKPIDEIVKLTPGISKPTEKEIVAKMSEMLKNEEDATMDKLLEEVERNKAIRSVRDAKINWEKKERERTQKEEEERERTRKEDEEKSKAKKEAREAKIAEYREKQKEETERKRKEKEEKEAERKKQKKEAERKRKEKEEKQKEEAEKRREEERTEKQRIATERILNARLKIEECKRKWMFERINFEMHDKPYKFPACAMKRKGIKHININLECQDNYRIFPDSEYMVIAVADGHGDKSHDLSEKGSELACNVLCSLVSKNNKTYSIDYFSSIGFKKLLVESWRDEVLKHHKKNYPDDLNSDDKITLRYGTTLLFAIAIDDFYVLGQLGDGGIIIHNKDNSSHIHKPLKTAKIGSGVSSICAKNAERFLFTKVYLANNVKGVVLMTDGYYDPWETEEKLYEASRFFLDTMYENNFDKSAVELRFKEKLDQAVDVVTDDITVGVLSFPDSKENKKGFPCYIKNEKIIDARHNCIRFETILNEQPVIGIYSPDISEINNSASTQISNVKFTIKKNEKSKNVLLFKKSDENTTISEYFDAFMIGNKRETDILDTLMIIGGILKMAKEKEIEQIIDRYDLSLLSQTLEFSKESIFICALNNKHKNYKTVVNIAKYIINLISIENVFFSDEPLNDYMKECVLETKNVNKFPYEYVELLLSATNKDSKLTIQVMLDETEKLLQNCVSCLCGRTIILNGKCNCICGKELEIFAYLENKSKKKIPLSANTITYIGKNKTLEVIKVKDKIGLKNISGSTMATSIISGETKEIEPNKVKDFSDCKTLSINGDEYTIWKKGKGADE